MHFEKKRAVLSVRSDTESRYLWGKYKQKNEKNTLQTSPKSDNLNDPSDADFQNATQKLKKKVNIQSCQFLQKVTFPFVKSAERQDTYGENILRQ